MWSKPRWLSSRTVAWYPGHAKTASSTCKQVGDDGSSEDVARQTRPREEAVGHPHHVSAPRRSHRGDPQEVSGADASWRRGPRARDPRGPRRGNVRKGGVRGSDAVSLREI